MSGRLAMFVRLWRVLPLVFVSFPLAVSPGCYSCVRVQCPPVAVYSVRLFLACPLPLCLCLFLVTDTRTRVKRRRNSMRMKLWQTRKKDID